MERLPIIEQTVEISFLAEKMSKEKNLNGIFNL